MIEQELQMNSMLKDDASFAKFYNFRELKSDFFDCIISNLPVFYQNFHPTTAEMGKKSTGKVKIRRKSPPNSSFHFFPGCSRLPPKNEKRCLTTEFYDRTYYR